MPNDPNRRRYVARSNRVKPPTIGQQARAYAEAWYRALRAWDLRQGTAPTPRMSYTGFRPGGFEISTLAELGGPSLPSFLRLPCGERSESEVAQIISTMQASAAHDRRDTGRLLDKIRDPRSGVPASLLREDGRWQRDAPRHAGYAVAVLTLAVALRDPQAEQFLPVCRNVMRALEKEADFG